MKSVFNFVPHRNINYRKVYELRFIKSVILLVLVVLSSCVSAQDDTLVIKKTFLGHKDGVECITVSPTGKYFATGGSQGNVILWDTSGNRVREFKGHTTKVTHIAFDKTGNKIAASYGYGVVYIWSTTTGSKFRSTNYLVNKDALSAAINFSAFSADAEFIYYGGGTSYLCKALVNQPDSDSFIIQQFGLSPITCGMQTPDRKYLAFSVDNMVKILDMKTDRIVKEIKVEGCKITSFCFTSDGKKLGVWCDDGKIKIVDYGYGKEILIFDAGGGPNSFSYMAFSKDDEFLVSGSDRYNINVWEAATGESKYVLNQHAGKTLAVNFFTGTEFKLLTGSYDKKIYLWQFDKKPELPEIVDAGKDAQDRIDLGRKLEAQKKFNVQETAKVKNLPPPDPKVYKMPKEWIGRRVLPVDSLTNKMTFSNGNLTIRVWDDKILDGDIVSIYVNDSCVVCNYELKANPKEVKLKFEKGTTCYILLHAHNMGTIAPNTANVSVTDGITQSKIELKSTMYESAVAKIVIK